MTNQRKLFEVMRTCLVILIAMAISLIIIFAVSKEPGNALFQFLIGPFTSIRNFGNVLELCIPLIFCGISISIMFSAGQFNMGAEGSFFFGAIIATIISLKIPMPIVIHPTVCILMGGIVGSLFCGIPAIMKVKWGSSELVSSLMFNYVAYFFGLYIINYFLRDTSAGAMVSHLLAETSLLPKIVPKTRISVGIIIAILVVIASSYFLNRTRWGYRIRLTGSNADFARYSGIDVNSVVVYSQLIGGFVAGIGGAIELLGLYNRFSWQSQPGYGWDGVIVAILARNNPKVIPIAAFFLAYLRIGADIMARRSDVPNEFVSIIQAVIIILIAATSFLAKYKHKLVVKEATGGAK